MESAVLILAGDPEGAESKALRSSGKLLDSSISASCSITAGGARKSRSEVRAREGRRSRLWRTEAQGIGLHRVLSTP